MGQAKQLFQSGLKEPYRQAVDIVLKEYHTKSGTWGKCKRNGKYGILTETGDWEGSFNRINTHDGIADIIINDMVNEDPNCFSSINDYNIWGKKIETFLRKNYDLYFTDKLGTKKYDLILNKLKSSWFTGIISVIIAIQCLYIYYPNIKEIFYDFKTGNNDDFNGIDLTIVFLDGTTITKQVKTGNIIGQTKTKLFIKGSVNDFKYTSNYIYSSVKNKYNDQTTCVMFKNDGTSNNIGENVEINLNLILFNYKISLPIPEILYEMGRFCFSNIINFNILSDGYKNSIIILPDNIIINLGNLRDDNKFEEILLLEFEKLKEELLCPKN